MIVLEGVLAGMVPADHGGRAPSTARYQLILAVTLPVGIRMPVVIV